jgi:hypothetical protein
MAAEEELPPLYVTEEEYRAEEEELAKKETQLRTLEARWEAIIAAQPEKLLVTEAEWRRERRRLQQLREELRPLWSRWGTYMRERRLAIEAADRAWTRGERAEAERFERSARAYLGLIREVMAEIRPRQRQLREEQRRYAAKLIVSPELARIPEEIQRLLVEIDEERERLGRKVIRPPLEYIGIEEPTGYEIYYQTAEKTYLIQHPKTKETVRTEDWLCIVWTGSVETEDGRSTDIPLALEVTMITRIHEMNAEEVTDLVREDGDLDSEAMAHFYGEGWAAPIRKVGISYIGYSLVLKNQYFEITTTVYDEHFRGTERRRRYSLYIEVPEYPTLRKYIERRSRYVAKRHYIDGAEVTLDQFIKEAEAK